MAENRFLFTSLLCIAVTQGFSQGATCATAIPINLDGALTSYSSSSSTGTSLVCTEYTGTAPITWFRFATNATGECPLLNISTSDSLRCEVAFYTACNGGQALQTASSMCFDDGYGLWAPSETFSLTANQTYFLRVRTSSLCTITIGGQLITPANNACSGASLISTSTTHDNNACHKGSTAVTPSQLCAFTLENTAFYRFVVATTGSAMINISNISCDNGSDNNSNGFQIGFFKGSCSSLIPINCTNGAGTFVQATTESLPAGTQVVVAIDGMSGSNCRYSLTGINVMNVLAEDQFIHFSVWKKEGTNLLRWRSRQDSVLYYDIERSVNGAQYYSIGRAPVMQGSHEDYLFEDKQPELTTYYRIKVTNKRGMNWTSNVVKAQRTDLTRFVKTNSVASNQLHIQLQNTFGKKIHYEVISMSGQSYLRERLHGPNTNLVRKDISHWPSGIYILSVSDGTNREQIRFVKP
jgi:hypothetical protein